MFPQKTHELKISFDQNKENSIEIKKIVMAWLTDNGVDSFVEGVLDSLDLVPDYEDAEHDFYGEEGGNLAPLSIFEYDAGVLMDLTDKLTKEFKEDIKIEHFTQETSTWMEGWKDSFKPLTTDKFLVYPPWEKPSDNTKIPIEIEPGMAFGTGQHATTMLCLRQIERVYATSGDASKLSFMDIGTGSGILSIGAKKLGFGTVHATDIEAAAVLATQENAKKNNVDISVWKGSVPVPTDGRDLFHRTYDVVVANILIIILERIIWEIAELLESGGRLILSGFIEEQEEHMRELADEAGLAIIERHTENDWICFELEKL